MVKRHPLADDQVEAFLGGDLSPLEAGLIRMRSETWNPDRVVRCYRIEVDHWPGDGKPWKRMYGPWFLNGEHGPPEHRWAEEIPDFVMSTLRGPSTYTGTVHTNMDDDIVGVVMPPIGPYAEKRQVYLSASGAHGIVKQAGFFGAVARVVRSKPVEWP